MLHTRSSSPCGPVNEGCVCVFFFAWDYGFLYDPGIKQQKQQPNVWLNKNKQKKRRSLMDRQGLTERVRLQICSKYL